MLKPFVEFYFPGVSCNGQKENKVSLLGQNEKKVNWTDHITIPEGAIAYRFFDKDEAGNKVDYSSYLWVGTLYSADEFKLKYPQLASNPELAKAKRIVKTETGGFYPIADEDHVVTRTA